MFDVITIESAVRDVFTQNHVVPLKMHGLQDEFAESGSAKDLWKKYKLDKEGTKEDY